VRRGRPLQKDEIERLAQQIEAWLVAWLIERANVPESEVARDRPFAEYGLDSLKAVEMSQELEEWLGVQLSAVIAWKYPTPEALAHYLAREAGGANTEAAGASMPLRKRSVAVFNRLLAEIEALSEHEANLQLADVN
jgi:acyl carrier protein